MFHEEQRVADRAGFARGDDLVLKAQAFGIWNAAELEQMQMHDAEEPGISPGSLLLIVI
jgi:predicted outer membrane lipoprotein